MRYQTLHTEHLIRHGDVVPASAHSVRYGESALFGSVHNMLPKPGLDLHVDDVLSDATVDPPNKLQYTTKRLFFLS